MSARARFDIPLTCPCGHCFQKLGDGTMVCRNAACEYNETLFYEPVFWLKEAKPVTPQVNPLESPIPNGFVTGIAAGTLEMHKPNLEYLRDAAQGQTDEDSGFAVVGNRQR